MERLRKLKTAACILLLTSSLFIASCEDDRILVNEVNHCSRLDFEGIKWPEALSDLAIDTYSLALNITGSYEGERNWSSLTNNFDGQGISLGIFQQNLGQGSLQPLLIKVDQRHSRIFSEYFDQSQRASLGFMLNAWSDRRRLNSINEFRSLASEGEEITFDSLSQFSSQTDINSGVELFGSDIVLAKASNSVNQFSVDWAVSNLFKSNGKSFKPEWKWSLQKLAGDSRYISLQVDKGHRIHRKAMKFMELYEARELRSYLFFYDIVVQNGGINEETRQDYLDDIKGKDLTENEKMRVLLSHRVLRSKKRWRADVMARKTTILDGYGRVHQKDRDFSKEFCLPQYDKMMIR